MRSSTGLQPYEAPALARVNSLALLREAEVIPYIFAFTHLMQTLPLICLSVILSFEQLAPYLQGRGRLRRISLFQAYPFL